MLEMSASCSRQLNSPKGISTLTHSVPIFSALMALAETPNQADAPVKSSNPTAQGILPRDPSGMRTQNSSAPSFLMFCKSLPVQASHPKPKPNQGHPAPCLFQVIWMPNSPVLAASGVALTVIQSGLLVLQDSEVRNSS